MAGADLTSVDAALKETWTEDRLAEQLYNENPLLQRIRRLKTTQVGQQAVTPIHTGRNFGYTALPAAGGTLNAAGQQELKQATWQYKHHNVQVKVQGSVIDGTRNDSLSVVEAVDMEVEGAIADLERQLTRQLFMSGNARIATGASASGSVVTLEAVSGHNAIERGWLAPGTPVDIGTSANEVSQIDNVLITAVSDSTSAPTITLASGTPTVSSSEFVSHANSRSGTTSYEMNGLDNIVDSADTLGGITVASTPSWASYEDSTSQALTLPLMMDANRQVMQKTGKGANYVVTSLKQQQKFYQLVQAQVRFAGDSGMGAGNVEGVKFNGMEVFAQPDCKNEHMFFLTIDDLHIVSAGDPKFQNKITGGNILSWIQGTDSFGAYVNVRHELGARRRNSHAKLTGLS